MSFSAEESARLFDRSYKVTPAGVHSNGRARKPHPRYFRAARGAEVWDVDGNRFLDLSMGNGAIILGHGYPRVHDAVREAIDVGLTIGLEWERTTELAEKFLQTVPTMDLVRFTNTGTEATLHALHIARFATGKVRIAKVEGCYHGWADEVFVSAFHNVKDAGSLDDIIPLPGAGGLNPAVVENVTVMPFNDIERTREVFEKDAKRLAAVIVEPVMVDIGFVPATKEYLSTLRELCKKHDIILIFDEVLTSFRLAPGGAQEYYGVTPDLAIYGKAIGNGFPIAAVAGQEALMRLTEPGNGPTFVGTFNGHVIPVAAGLATLPLLADGSVQSTLDERTERLRRAFEKTADSLGVKAQFQGGGGHLHFYFTETTISDYRSAVTTNADMYSAFALALLDQGILISPKPLSHQHLSLAHENDELEKLELAFEVGLKAVARVADL